MSKRKKKLALGLLISSSCVLVAFFAASAWFFEGTSLNTAQAQELEPTPLPALIGSVLPPEPPIDTEASRAAFDSADGLTAKLRSLKSTGIEMWRPAETNPSQTTPTTEAELTPEEETAIEDLVAEFPPVKANIARDILNRRLAH